MRKSWYCYSWRGVLSSPENPSVNQTWSSPEGAVEFLRRQLEDHGLYSKEILVSALADLRQDKPVKLHFEIPSQEELHLMVVKQ